MHTASVNMKSQLVEGFAATCIALVLLVGLAGAYSTSGTVTASITVPLNSLVLTNISTSSNLYVGASLPFYATLNNSGALATTNIIINVSITGPAAFNSSYSVSSLTPEQTENVTIQISGVTSAAGTYTLNAFASYYIGNTILVTNSKSTQYTVITPSQHSGGGGGGGGGPSITPVPGITIITIPLTTSTIAGQGLVTQIGVQSTSNSPQVVNFSVGSNFTRLVNISVGSLYLNPGQAATLQAIFKTTANTLPGTYVIPLVIKTSVSGGGSISTTEYLTFTVYNNLKNGLQIIGQTYLTNSLATLSGIISIGNSGNSIIQNGTLYTTLPSMAISNASQIYAYGLPNNITKTANGYTIAWHISKISSGQEFYAYYEITNLSRINLISYAQNVFVEPGPITSSSVLRIADISAPTFYSDSFGSIKVLAFYTGTATQQVTAYLSGPLAAGIKNATLAFNATPNKLLPMNFSIYVGNYTGTLLFYLYISTQGANLTEPIPVIVLRGNSSVVSTTTIPQKPIVIGQEAKLGILGGVAALAIVLIIVVSMRKVKRRRPKYDQERASKVIRLKKSIEGGSDE